MPSLKTMQFFCNFLKLKIPIRQPYGDLDEGDILVSGHSDNLIMT